MEFEGNKAYLNEFERRQAGFFSGSFSPFLITSESLQKLNDSVLERFAAVDQLAADCDTRSHQDNIAIFVARNRAIARQRLYGKIVEYANEELPDLFSKEFDELTPESFLELTTK